MMPVIGEIRAGGEAGYSRQRTLYIWNACVDCGNQRWVQYVKSKGKDERCHLCAVRKSGLTQRGTNSKHWKGGRRDNGKGYIRFYYPNHPRADGQGYVREHLLVWEEVNHQQLPAGWIIHHINGDKGDNRPLNLTAMPKSGHSPALSVKVVQKRLRELEIENRQLRRALEDSQLIWLGEN